MHYCNFILFMWIVRRLMKPFRFLLVFSTIFYSSYFIMVLERFWFEPSVDRVSIFTEWRAPWSSHGSKEARSFTEWRMTTCHIKEDVTQAESKRNEAKRQSKSEHSKAGHPQEKGLSCITVGGQFFEVSGLYRTLFLTGALSRWRQCASPPLTQFAP